MPSSRQPPATPGSAPRPDRPATTTRPSDHPELLAVARTRYRSVDADRFPGLTHLDTTIAALGVTRRAVLTHSTSLHAAQPAIDERSTWGVRPGLSIDVEVALASKMFTQMRVLPAVQRTRPVGSCTPRIANRDVLGFATLDGARAIALESVTGSLTPVNKPTWW